MCVARTEAELAATGLDYTVADLGTQEGCGSAVAETETSLVDWDAALHVVAGSEDVLKEIAKVAIEELEKLTNELGSYVAEYDQPQIKSTAHTMQGTLRVFQNEFAMSLLLKLQTENVEKEEIVSAYEQLEPLLKLILGEITAYYRGDQ